MVTHLTIILLRSLSRSLPKQVSLVLTPIRLSSFSLGFLSPRFSLISLGFFFFFFQSPLFHSLSLKDKKEVDVVSLNPKAELISRINDSIIHSTGGQWLLSPNTLCSPSTMLLHFALTTVNFCSLWTNSEVQLIRTAFPVWLRGVNQEVIGRCRCLCLRYPCWEHIVLLNEERWKEVPGKSEKEPWPGCPWVTHYNQ